MLNSLGKFVVHALFKILILITSSLLSNFSKYNDNNLFSFYSHLIMILSYDGVSGYYCSSVKLMKLVINIIKLNFLLVNEMLNWLEMHNKNILNHWK